MSGWLVLVVAGLLALLVVLAFVRGVWRVWRGEETSEPAGSYGTLLRRDRQTRD